jgi:hypothetical protein
MTTTIVSNCSDLINADELRKPRSSVTLIDLRPAEDFAVGHSEGSMLIALKSLDYPNIKHYVRAWGEWGNHDDSMIVIAEPGK